MLIARIFSFSNKIFKTIFSNNIFFPGSLRPKIIWVQGHRCFSKYLHTCISVTLPRLPFPPSWSSHCQSTPRITLAPGNIPRTVIFLLFLRGSINTLSNKHFEDSEHYSLNSLPNDKILDVTNLKAFADDKLQVAKMTIFLFDRVDKSCRNESNSPPPFPALFPETVAGIR